MTVYVLMLVQPNPLRSETLHSIYNSLETAENAAQEIEYQLPKGFELAIEPFEVIEEEEFE